MRRRYSDFEWLRNELERDSKVSKTFEWMYLIWVNLNANCNISWRHFFALLINVYHWNSLNWIQFQCIIIFIFGHFISIQFYLFFLFLPSYTSFRLCCCCCSGLGAIQIVVPPLPGKAWKRQMPFRGDDGLFDENFIEERRKGLESFINKIAGHPLAQNERCLHMFLQEPTIDKNYVPGKIRNT